MSVLVLVLAVCAACCLGTGFVLQQQAAQQAPPADRLSWRLLLGLVRMPRWLTGIAFMVCGMALGALALGQGEVTLVEPLLATNLLFALVLSRALTGQRLGRQGWAGLLLLAGGVAVFILAGRPEGSDRVAGPLRHWLVFGTVTGVALALAATAACRTPALGRDRGAPAAGRTARAQGHGPGPALLGAAAGLLYGVQDALTRVSGELLGDGGWPAFLGSWQPYAVLVLGITGLVLVQSAFESAPLRMSLPALTAAQPLAGMVCGVGFLGDRIRTGTGALAWEAAGLAAVVTGIVLLGLHPALPARPGPPATADEVPDLQPG